MRTRKLRLVSALLALAMMFVLLPTAAFAEDTASTLPALAKDEFDYNGLRYKKLNATDVAVVGPVRFDPALDRDRVIPETAIDEKDHNKEYTVTKIEERAFACRHNPANKDKYEDFVGYPNFSSVTIPKTVTVIQKEAFNGGAAFSDYGGDQSRGLHHIIFAQGSQLQIIGEGAFSGCYTLTGEIEIPNTVENIESGAFNGCPLVEKFVFQDGSQLKSIGTNAFRWLDKVENFVLPEGVTEIPEHAFRGCTHLKEFVVPASVKNIKEDAFGNCKELQMVTIPDSVRTIANDAFSGCDNLKAVYYDGTYYGKTESDWKSIVSNSTELAKATVYYARKVSFDLNGHDGTAPKAQKVYNGSKVEKPTEKPKTSGYTFENWYADAECTKLFDFDEPITQNTTIYAGWTKDPVGNHVTVENGTAWVGEKQLTSEDIVEPCTTVTIKSNEKFAGDMVFDYWKDWNGNVTFANDHSAETTFVMPEGAVKVEAVAKTVEEDSDWDAGTVVTTAVLGTGMAVLAYHIGTEVYAEQVLGAGVAVPRTRGDVALKAWELAGKPAVENAAVAPEEAAQAQQWVLESGLMENQKDGTFHPEKWMSRLAALRVLDKAQKMG